MLLAGTQHVTDGFTVTALPADGGLTWVRLAPRKDDSDFKEIRLGFASGTLKRLEFADKLNQLTRVDLTKLEQNAKLPDSLFKFVAPPGVDVIGPKR
jgi:outer membrane lipoprotein carrier protein